tara:strand:+ start:48 stop:1328 length:1281 start_codon:yes stop_codon:yes gene_type:complete
MGGQAKKMGMPGGSDATRTSHHDLKRLSAYQKELLIRDGNICHKHTPVKDFGPSETSDNAIADRYLILKNLLQSDDVTVSKLRFALHLIESGDALEAYSNKEIANIVGKSERTAQSIRLWASSLFLGQSTPRKKVAACSVVLSSKLENKSVHTNLHAAKKCVGPTWTLVLQKLQAIRFNCYPGEVNVPLRARRTAAWIERWGVENVLHALWLAEGPNAARRRNPAGYIRSLVESGKQAPEGWVHPELRENAENAALGAATGPEDESPPMLRIQFPEMPSEDLLATLRASPFEYVPHQRLWCAAKSPWAIDVYEKVEAFDGAITWADGATVGRECAVGALNGIEAETEADSNRVGGSAEAEAERSTALLVLSGCRGIAPPFVYSRAQDAWTAPDSADARRIFEVARTKFGAKAYRIDASKDAGSAAT